MYQSYLGFSGDGTVDRDQRQVSKRIQRHTGRTFHLATRLLPSRYRDATYVLYAFFRIADDVVDTTEDTDAATQRAELDRIRAAALGERETDDPVLSAFRALCTEHQIPAEEIETFLNAMERDVSHTRYETYEQLETYLRGSAVAVAYMMLAVMDPADNEAAKPHARALGEAFQLTNFLRDVKEDVDDYGRVYLPQRTLRAHGVTEADLADGTFSPGFAAVMRTELQRTERLYRNGVAGIRRLPDDCQFAVLLAAVLYAEHHRLIRARRYDVLSSRPELTTATRVKLLARTWWFWQRERDPERVFYRVSPISESPDATMPAVPATDGERPPDETTGYLTNQLPAWLTDVTDR